jgi:multiple sugar transport system substrate-binding protein
MKNRTLRIPVLFVCLVLFLAACQPGGKVTQSVTPDLTQSPVVRNTPGSTLAPTLTPVPEIMVDPANLKGVQIHLLHPFTGETGQMITRMVDQFNQSNSYGIFVIEIAPGSTGLVIEKFNELRLNNLTPEVVVASPSHLIRMDSLYASMVDLNPYVQSSKYGLSALEQGDFLPAFWNESLSTGKRYGIPAYRDSEMLFYNITWARELGFKSSPATWEEFRQQSCAANALMRKDSDTANDGLGGWIINTNALVTLSWLRTFGSDPTAMDAIQFSSDASQEAFIQLLKLETDTCAWNSRLPQPYDYFTNRQALFYSGSMEDLRAQEKNTLRLAGKDEWTVIPYPIKTGKPFMLTEGLDYGLTTSTDEKQLAGWLFIKWLSAPEQQGWLLRASGSLPLGQKAKPLSTDIPEDYPMWQDGVDLMTSIQPIPASQELDIAKMVLEDGAWALFKTGMKPEGIPALLTQIDDTIAELAAYRK